MANVYFIGDLHLGHKNIMSFGNRNFSTIEEHDHKLVELWNQRITKRDLVWVLGDTAMSVESLDLMKYMNGTKRLVMGNHDLFDTQVYLKYFQKVYGVVRYKQMVLSHVPIHPKEMAYRWKINVHGHIHHPEKDLQDPAYFNVNADVNGMVPIRLDELRTKINEKRVRLGYNEIDF